MRLGIDTYSLKDQGWDAFQMLDYAAQQGLHNVHFSERSFFDSLETQYLKRVLARAEHLGLTLEIGMRSIDRYALSFDPTLGTGEDQLHQMLDAAATVGSPVVRCFMGFEADRMGKVPLEEHIAETVRVLRAVAPRCRQLGIKIALENHGGVDLLARELRGIIEAVGFETVGACLDTGNPAYGGEDPLLSAEVLSPYIITCHMRDTRIWQDTHGAQAQWVPMGQGSVDLAAIVAVLRNTNPQLPIDLEIITGRGPKALPYFDENGAFWLAYPNVPGRDLMRFVNLARAGVASPLVQLTTDLGSPATTPQQRAEFLRQQRQHFETSVTFARDALHV